MKSLLRSPGVGRSVLDYCRFGMKWKKPMAMVYTSKVFPALQKLALRCVCITPHQELRGGVRTPAGWRRWTALAAPYPPELCFAHARVASEDIVFEQGASVATQTFCRAS